jgi:hypothetical protein
MEGTIDVAAMICVKFSLDGSWSLFDINEILEADFSNYWHSRLQLTSTEIRDVYRYDCNGAELA